MSSEVRKVKGFVKPQKEGPQKAIVAGLVAFLMIVLADRGWVVDESFLTDMIQAIVGGIVTGISTWAKRNRKVKR